jgi:hypothetical protein
MVLAAPFKISGRYAAGTQLVVVVARRCLKLSELTCGVSASRRSLSQQTPRGTDWKSVLLRQGPQLFQGETAAAAGFGYQHPGPYALGARGLTGLPSAPPAAGTLAAQRLGALVGNRRPSVRIPRTHQRRDRGGVDLHPVHLPGSA